MANSTQNILIVLTLINLTASTYRIIIIENGYTAIDKTDNIFIMRKKFAALLFKTENYTPIKKAIFEIYDSNNWEILDFKEFISDLDTVTSDNHIPFQKGFFYRECPISNVKIEINKLDNTNLYSFERGFLENPSDDGNSVFSFYRVFSEDLKYQNSGFSLIMAKTEFSFFDNIYYMEDFNSEMDPSKINLDFTAERYKDNNKDSYEINKMKFKLTIQEKTENHPNNYEMQKFSKNVNFFKTTKENINFLKVNLPGQSFPKDLKIEFQYEKPRQGELPDIFTTNNAIMKKNNKIQINLYCELKIDNIKRFFKTKTINQELKNFKSQNIANLCFNSNKKDNKKNDQIQDPFKRKFNFSNVEIFPFSGYGNNGINSLIISIKTESLRGDIEEFEDDEDEIIYI